MYDDGNLEMQDLRNRGAAFAATVINQLSRDPTEEPEIDSVTHYLLTERWDWQKLPDELTLRNINGWVHEFAAAYADLQKGNEDQDVILFLPKNFDVPDPEDMH